MRYSWFCHVWPKAIIIVAWGEERYACELRGLAARHPEWIAFSDNSWSLYLLNLESEGIRRIASEPMYGPAKTLRATWSPDSRWIAHTRSTLTYFGQAWLYDVETGESRPVTDGLSDVWEPVFDAGGKYLFFSASTDVGPLRTWFALSGQDMRVSNSLYLAVLDADRQLFDHRVGIDRGDRALEVGLRVSVDGELSTLALAHPADIGLVDVRPELEVVEVRPVV